MRVFAVSDIHLDFEENIQWIDALSSQDYLHDVLILAGDVSDVPALLEHCFSVLAKRFYRVLYVPGNHDLWVHDNQCASTSLEKFQQIYELANSYGVLMNAFYQDSLCIVPLLGWYDYSFGEVGSRIRERWMDFRACIWPDGWGDKEVTQHFIQKNEPLPTIPVESKTVISFSHFLPRIDLLPRFIPKKYKILYPVLGTTLLEAQIRQLKSTIHVYGHSHVNRNVKINGVRYINNALGYPTEGHHTSRQLQCIYDSQKKQTMLENVLSKLIR